MKKTNASVKSAKEDCLEEQILFTYDENERRQNIVNAANAKHIFSPKFIPVNPKWLKFLTPIESMVFGFIDFYSTIGS